MTLLSERIRVQASMLKNTMHWVKRRFGARAHPVTNVPLRLTPAGAAGMQVGPAYIASPSTYFVAVVVASYGASRPREPRKINS
jgi:hypothetical protein